ncbi:hypothetical protein FOQG_18429 [Fusarium oxysporum f. sp. raphani 54005]|uniref:Uncharacterized protein n=2 Tax=Fusarium oxysporum TaxID=5507 RepID=X0BED4_FUSOX|nr:hypothetical protein FOQG_18429 [Fusarium oxysporum f. sp. raphani 54005]EXL65796.1 hypothetical protein FOPG_17999 [Fusarium oxysporum f. sp. conglutinans race 2 54008]
MTGSLIRGFKYALSGKSHNLLNVGGFTLNFRIKVQD